MDKKAISPLLSTLILIALSIGLGAVVMSWGRGYIEERAEFVGQAKAVPIGCNNIQWGLWRVGGLPQYCTDGNKVRVLLENNQNSRMDDIEARIAGTAGAYTKMLSTPLTAPAGFTLEFEAGEAGEIQQIKLIPILLIDKTRQYCTDKTIIIESPIPRC